MIKILWLGFGLIILQAINDGAWPAALFLFLILAIGTLEALR